MKKTFGQQLGQFFCYAFGVLFLLFPFTVLKESRIRLLEKGHFPAVVLLAVCFAAGAYFVHFFLKEQWFPSWMAVGLPAALSVVFRTLCRRKVGAFLVMKYDYLTALESARGVYAAKEAIFPHWAYYPRLLSLWMRLFGQSQGAAVAFNIFVGALSCVLISLIAKEIFGSNKTAFFASLLFAFWPSYGLYCGITSNEHLCLLFLLLCSYFFILALGAEGWRRWIFLAAAGLFAGATDLFKQFSPVFLIAAAAVILIRLLTEKGSRKNLLCFVLCLLLMFGCGLAVKTAAKAGLERYLGQPVADSMTGHFLLIGLNSEGGGMWSEEYGSLVYELCEAYSNDYKAVNEELTAILKADLKAHPDSLIPTLQHKFLVDWSADSGVVDWVNALYPGGLPHRDWVYSLCGAYYAGLFLLILAGAVMAFFEKDPSLMYLRLICFGYFLLFMLSEAQGRYQLVLFPVFALLAASGLKDPKELRPSLSGR